jgi:KaiC/GvpD/RAD55 family RecA-like ATPase
MEKEKGLYVAIDEKPADVIEQAASLGWDLAPFIESREFLILDASAYFNTRVNDGANTGVDVERVVSDLKNYISRMGASRVVIDPVGPLLFSRDATSRALDQARMLFYGLQANTQTTNLLTTYSVQRNARHRRILGLRHLRSRYGTGNSRFVRTLSIEKMRSTALAPAQYVFNIVQDRGIVLQGVGETAAG